jgi:hypothetical protein
MPTINQLPTLDTLEPSNQVPTYSVENGDARKFSLSTLTAYIQDNLVFPDPENASGITYDPAGTGAVSRSVQSKLRDVVSVRDFGAVGDGVADDTAAIQAAITASPDAEVVFPSGTYKVVSAISLNGFGGIIRFSGNGSKIIAGANNIKIFESTTQAYGCRIIDAFIDGNGRTGVTGFDLTRLQLRGASLVRPTIINCEYGIYLRSLCWGLTIDAPETDTVSYPITLVEGCNAITINHPSIDHFGVVGIWIKTGGAYPNVGNIVLNGYIQNGTEGIVDQGYQTQVIGTYFEGNSAADIALKTDSSYFYSCATNHTASGARGYRAELADSAMIVHPFMSSGARSIGLFDFEASCTNCYYDAIFGAGSKNTPIGIVTGIKPITNRPGPIGGVSADSGAFTTLSASGIASLAAGAKTGSGTVTSAASGVANTLFTISAGNRGRYEVVAMIANSGNASLYTVFATVIWDGNGSRIVANNTANMTITMSGSNVQATQSSGLSNNIVWSYIFTTVS